MRLNIPAVFVSGGPMEAGEIDGGHYDLIDTMVKAADNTVSDEKLAEFERKSCAGLRMLFRNVYRKFHELPYRGHRVGPRRQRNASGDSPKAQGVV